MLFPTILPTDLSFQRTHPYTDSLGWVCSANAHRPSLRVLLGLLEPQLASCQPGLGTPSRAWLKKGQAWPKPSSHRGGSGPWPGDGHPRVAIPQCTVPQRESSRGASRHRGHPPRDSRLQYCSQKDKGQAALGTLRLHSPLRKSQQSDSVFFSPCLSPSPHPHAAEPFHFSHKGNIEWGRGVPGSLLSHTYDYVNTFFLKREKKISMLLFCRLRFIVPV